MAGITCLRDFVRNSVGVGINGATYLVKKLFDDVTIASGSTASDTDPNTPILGMFSVDETTFGYPGPSKYIVTDAVSGAVREHTSKSIGLVGSWRSIDVPRFWRLAGKGVVPGVGSDLAVSTNGANLIISVAAGEYIGLIGEYGLFYAWPAARTVTAATADGANPRIDTVVLRFYPPGVEQEGRIDLVLLPGTPAASPVAPTLTQSTTTYWEEPLANVQVDAGVTSLAVNKVTDRRTYCFLYPGSITAGDTLYVDANGKLARLGKGTANQVLQQGATIPSWASTLAGMTLTAPTIADFTNAAHDHGDADDGGTLVVGAYPTMVGDSGAGGTKGAVPAPGVGDAAAGKYLKADGVFTVPPVGGDASTNTAVSVDSEIALFSSTTGKILKRATLSGIAKVTSGVLSVVTAPAGSLVGDTETQTLTNKTLTSPTINTPTIAGGTWAGGTDLAVVDGGTGSSTAAGARTNLGVVIGTDVQALDATLTALAAYNTAGILTQTAADTFAGRTITGTASEITVVNGSGVAGNPTLSLASGIDATKIGAGGVTSTEFGYIGTLTSDAQTQIDGKSATSHTHTTFSVPVAFSGAVTIGDAQTDSITIMSHVFATGADPVVTATPVGTYPAAGTTPTGVSLVYGNDTAGEVGLTTGTAPSGTVLCNIAFATARNSSNYAVFLQRRTSGGATMNIYPSGRSTAGFNVSVATAPAASTDVSFLYWVIEG